MSAHLLSFSFVIFNLSFVLVTGRFASLLSFALGSLSWLQESPLVLTEVRGQDYACIYNYTSFLTRSSNCHRKGTWYIFP